MTCDEFTQTLAALHPRLDSVCTVGAISVQLLPGQFDAFRRRERPRC